MRSAHSPPSPHCNTPCTRRTPCSPQDFNFRELFVPEGNWLHEAFAVEDRYFGGEKVPISAFTRSTVDGRDYYHYQDQLQALSDALA